MTKHTATIEFPKEFIIDIASYAMSDPLWIDKVEIEGERKGEYISDHIANGGTILMHDCEMDEWHTSTAKQCAQAVGTYIQMLYVDESLHGCYLDDATAEAVLQIAVFGDVIYG